MVTSPQTAFRVSPRRELRPGMTFRTIRGSGPTHAGQPIGEFGTFRCLRLYRKARGGRRLYCAAISEATGAVHDLYIDGPAFTSKTGTREKPYRVKLIAPELSRRQQSPRRKPR